MSVSYQELLAKKAELANQAVQLEMQLADARKAQRAEVIANIKNLLADNGLSIADLGLKDGVAKRSGPAKGQTVPPKYRDPETGRTWTGRGAKPRWVADALAAGKSLDDLRI